MDQYNVLIFPAAKQDLLEIIDYLNTFSETTALRYYDRIVEEISSLSIMPNRSKPRDLVLAVKGYRYLIVENYLVFFVINDKNVEIRRILYRHRNFSDIL